LKKPGRFTTPYCRPTVPLWAAIAARIIMPLIGICLAVSAIDLIYGDVPSLRITVTALAGAGLLVQFYRVGLLPFTIQDSIAYILIISGLGLVGGLIKTHSWHSIKEISVLAIVISILLFGFTLMGWDKSAKNRNR
jgi:hypothetical protein